MKKRILFISPAFANGGVIYKYDCRYLESWCSDFDFILASVRNKLKLPNVIGTVWSTAMFPRSSKIIQARYFKGFEPCVPDISRITISPFLKYKCAQYIKLHKIDAIHTVSFPCSSHLIGAYLKKKYDLPWIAHFYDPWVDNPLRNIPKCLHKMDMEQERMVAENANAIIHSNYVIKGCWVERYGKGVENKIHIIPFGYGQSQMKAFKPMKERLPHSDTIVLSYIGTTAGDRNFQSLIKAVNLFAKDNPQLRGKIKIRLLGNLLQEDKELICQYNLKDIVHFVGRVSPDNLSVYFKQSDVFLVIDSPQQRNVFFPSKLVDYFYYQKPILGISPKVGVTHQYLTQSGNYCYDNSDIKAIAAYLKQITVDFKSVMNYDKDYYLNFSPSTIATTYKSIINEITQ